MSVASHAGPEPAAPVTASSRPCWRCGLESLRCLSILAKELDLRSWHHVALVLGGAGPKDAEVPLKLYLDGQEVAQGKAPALGAHPGDINLGRCGNTLFHDRRRVEQPGHYFAGRLDDFRIANRSLAPEEVRALAGAR